MIRSTESTRLLSPTLADIAHHAGVSKRLVEHVMGGHAGKSSVRCSGKTRVRVRSLAASMGYHRNYAAAALHSGRSGTLGLLSPHRDAFWLRLDLGIEAAAHANGLGLVRVPGDAIDEIWSEGLAYFRSRRVDGLIAVGDMGGGGGPGSNGNLEEAPVVWVAQVLRRHRPSVSLHEGAGIRLAVEHLAGLGHRHLHYAGLDWRGARCPRRKAFHAACAQRGLSGSETILRSPATPARVDEFYRQLRETFPPDPPTGVACWNDEIAMALCTLFKERGIAVPGEVSVVGFDDLSERISTPPLTSVSHMLGALGEAAVELLLARIERRAGEGDSAVRRIVPELAVRQSTGPAPHDFEAQFLTSNPKPKSSKKP